jgi:hypothetical protein
MADSPTMMEERTPEPPESEWMPDREVFAREAKTVTGSDGVERKSFALFITEAAKKRWSAFNPRGFTHEVALQAVLRARGGNYLEAIARAVGVPRPTLTRWLAMKEGSDHWEGKPLSDGGLLHDTEELRAFRKEFYSSEGQVECDATAAILRLGHAGDGRLLLEYLARRHPDRWRQRNSVINENADGSPVQPPPIHITFGDGPGDDPVAVPAVAKPEGS